MPAQIQIGRSPQVTYTQNELGWFIGEQDRECPNKFKSPTFPQLNLSVDNIYLEGDEYFIRLASPHQCFDTVPLVGQNFEVSDCHTLKTVGEAGRNKVADLFFYDNQFIVSDCIQVHPTTPNYSFARLRRIWQTTQTFWQDVCPTDPEQRVEESLVGQILKDVSSHRIQIIPHDRDNLDLGHYHTFDLKLTDSVKLSVVWDPKRKLFITCDDLDYLQKSKLLGKPVLNSLQGELTLEEPSGYGSQNEIWGKIIIEKASKMENSGYTPAIPILAQPRTFMALVPADRAVNIVAAIQTKYEREMGKVRNRLPLHLGVVYFQRRMPLRAALDAGRRMLNYELGIRNYEAWLVKRVEPKGKLPDEKKHLAEGTQQFEETVIIELEQNGRFLTWYVPAKMGDGQTDDNWYPYVFIKSDVSGRNLVFKAPRPKSDGTTAECWLIHASQLKEGDQIYFTPATLDFQWLDSTARRFEIAYDDNGKRRDRLTRPYLLDQLDELEAAWGMLQSLSKNQLYALRDTIEQKREAWFDKPQESLDDETFEQFCADVVRNTKWKTAVDHQELTNWAINGLLADTIQLHLSIMKENLQSPQEEQPHE